MFWLSPPSARSRPPPSSVSLLPPRSIVVGTGTLFTAARLEFTASVFTVVSTARPGTLTVARMLSVVSGWRLRKFVEYPANPVAFSAPTPSTET